MRLCKNTEAFAHVSADYDVDYFIHLPKQSTWKNKYSAYKWLKAPPL